MIPCEAWYFGGSLGAMSLCWFFYGRISKLAARAEKDADRAQTEASRAQLARDPLNVTAEAERLKACVVEEAGKMLKAVEAFCNAKGDQAKMWVGMDYRDMFTFMDWLRTNFGDFKVKPDTWQAMMETMDKKAKELGR